MTMTLLTLAGAVLLLVSGKLRNDVVALLVVLTLAISGVLEPAEALSGFSSNVVIIIASMFIVGKAITHTGIAQRVGRLILKYGGADETRLMTMIMLAAAFVGAFMSSTATAAIFIPITLSVAEKAGLNHKRLLMPLAAASLISGMMTLVATTPNIVMNSALADRGLPGLSFFGFTPFGLCILALAIVFMALVGRRLLAPKTVDTPGRKDPTIDDLLKRHKIAKHEYQLRVPQHSDLVDKSLARMQLNARYRVIVLAVQSSSGDGRRTSIVPARPETVIKEGDIILLIGSPEHVDAFIAEFSLQKLALLPARRRAFFRVVGVAEVMLNPDSSLIGKTLRETGFQALVHSMVLGVRRKGTTLSEDITDLPLAFGDVLLVCGAWTDILQLGKHRDKYLLLTLPQDYKEYIPGQDKQHTALALLAGMVALMAFNVLPPVTAVLAAAVALILTRCVPLTSVYDVIDWQTVVMIAGIMPLAVALQKTGLIADVSAGFLQVFSGAAPALVLAGLFLVTAMMGMFISNTAVAVLVAPMAIDVGMTLGINPQACAMVAAIACSAAYTSPLGSPVSMLVREPGGYGFADYAKTGLPLLLLTLPATVLLAWLLYL